MRPPGDGRPARAVAAARGTELGYSGAWCQATRSATPVVGRGLGRGSSRVARIAVISGGKAMKATKTSNALKLMLVVGAEKP